MKERKRKLGAFALSLRLYTLKDKAKPMFRAKEPDRHCVEIVATRPSGGTIVIRDFWFEQAKPATDHYNHLLGLFGKGK